MKNRALFLGLVFGALLLGPADSSAQHSSSASHTVSITVLPRHEVSVDPELRFNFESAQSQSQSDVTTSTLNTQIGLSESSHQVRLSVSVQQNDSEDLRLRLAVAGQPSISLNSTSRNVFSGSTGNGALDLVVEAEVDGDWLYRV